MKEKTRSSNQSRGTRWLSSDTSRAASSSKEKVLKDNCQLFSRLFISCQTRQCDLQEFFKHENQPTPASLSDSGKFGARFTPSHTGTLCVLPLPSLACEPTRGTGVWPSLCISDFLETYR